MACFLAPVAEAVIVTIAAKVMEKREVERPALKVSFDGVTAEPARKTPFSKKLKWLSRMLWGGSALLAFEHVWHGEVVPYFPFLTAASNAADAKVMLHEIATVGVTMAVLVTVVWLGMLGVSAIVEKRAEKQAAALAGTEN